MIMYAGLTIKAKAKVFLCVFNFTASAAGPMAFDGTISRSEHNQPTDCIYI